VVFYVSLVAEVLLMLMLVTFSGMAWCTLGTLILFSHLDPVLQI